MGINRGEPTFEHVGGCFPQRFARARDFERSSATTLRVVDRGRGLERADVPDWFERDRTELDARLGDVRAPTLLLFGDHDPIAPVAVGEHLRSLVPGARLVVVHGETHVFAEERPDVAVILDVRFTVTRDFRAARASLASDHERSSVRYAGTVDGLTGLVADIELAGVADGVTLIPEGSSADLDGVGRDVLNRLALRGRATA